MERIICLTIGYIFGLFQTGYIYGRLHNIDIRHHGSGNAGSTNVLRTLGKKAGLVTLIGDSAKCILAVVLVKIIFAENNPDALPLLGLYAGAGAVLGHNFPFFLKFQGGKGIATTIGLLLATNIWIAFVAMISFILIVYITKYVSVGSILIVVIFAIGIIIYGQMGGFHMQESLLIEMYVLAIIISVLAVYRHRSNIVRLMHGEENKIKMKKSSQMEGK